MIVKYLGVLEKQVRGCRPCGRKRTSKKVVASRKSFTLLSGATKMFYLNREAEVSDADGRFLVESFPESFEEVK